VTRDPAISPMNGYNQNKQILIHDPNSYYSIVAYTFHVITLYYEGVKPERHAHLILLVVMIVAFALLENQFAPKKKIPIK
jgi:hypothetical protein